MINTSKGRGRGPGICSINKNQEFGIIILLKYGHVISDSMGVYKYYQMYNGYPSYHGPSGKRLYYLIGSGWLIGPTLGNLTGYVHNGNHYQCPYLIPNGWMYVNSGYWYNDDTLIVRCIS